MPNVLLRDQPPFPGAVDLCLQYAEAGGTNFLYTGRSQAEVERFLAAFGLTNLFAGWITGGDGYPNQAGIDALVEALPVIPAQTMLISNRGQDIRAARMLGMPVALFDADITPAAAFYTQLIGQLLPATVRYSR
jgi:phosphoglycolate phosphatase-like HAD superfamily hydrolase